MRPLISDVGDGRADGRCDLPLHCGVPCIDSWETVIKGTYKGIDAVGQKRLAVGSKALRFCARRIGDLVAVTCRKSRRWIQSDRPGRQEKGSIEVLSGCQSRRRYLLASQHRQVLRNGVAKDRPENANVVTATIAQPHHGLLVPLICDT